MNKLENFGAPADPKGLVIEEINDYENTEIHQMLEEAGMAKGGYEITADDYEATKTRAVVLAKEANEPISAQSLLLGAFADRMIHTGKIGEQELKSMSDDAIRSIMYAREGYLLDDEELGMVRSSPLPLKEWSKERESIKEQLRGGFDVAVDGTETVVASGDTPKEALREAQKG